MLFNLERLLLGNTSKTSSIRIPRRTHDLIHHLFKHSISLDPRKIGRICWEEGVTWCRPMSDSCIDLLKLPTTPAGYAFLSHINDWSYIVNWNRFHCLLVHNISVSKIQFGQTFASTVTAFRTDSIHYLQLLKKACLGSTETLELMIRYFVGSHHV